MPSSSTSSSPLRQRRPSGDYDIEGGTSSLLMVASAENDDDRKKSARGAASAASPTWWSRAARLAALSASSSSDDRGAERFSPATGTKSEAEESAAILRQENAILRDVVRKLESENEQLKKQHGKMAKIVIETFEGEGQPMVDASGQEVHAWFEGGQLMAGEDDDEEGEASATLEGIGGGGVGGEGRTTTAAGVTMTEAELETAIAESASLSQPKPNSELWCDELADDNTCPVEPDVSFRDALRDRGYWLVGLLALQSCSGIILARNEALLQSHPVIVYFLTMLVGAGGNAGNQASVRVIRGLALGTLNERTQNQFLSREFKMAVSLSSVLSLAGFVRAAVFRTPFPETIAVTSALGLIVFSSICLGAVLPLLLKKMGIDPAHSSTTIQVVMDILGVVLTVFVSTTILDSPIGQLLIEKLSFRG